MVNSIADALMNTMQQHGAFRVYGEDIDKIVRTVLINKDGKYPDLYAAFDGIEFVPDTAAVDQQLVDDLNNESGLLINRAGDAKIQKIIESAFNQTATFDEIMADWNSDWADAQETLSITAQ